jgi:uncharacterized protein YndB with AHSA1/START domain
MKQATTQPASHTGKFDMSPYTGATLRLDMRISFSGKTPAEVFEVMGDPERIKDWYLLAKEVRLLPPGADGEVNFDVVFTFFGQVHEEILHWDMPHRYVYKAVGDDFPIKDYVALIDIQETGPGEGVMIWRQYFDDIEGEHNQRILPIILPPINEASLQRLAILIGGTKVEVKTYF